MKKIPFEVLFEDNHCLAINKPAGIASAHYQGEEETLDRLVKAYLKQKYGKPGNVFLGVVHRIDRPVSGVLLFARTSKGAARLAEQFREGTLRKSYWAVVEGQTLAAEGRFSDWLRKDRTRGVVDVVAAGSPGAKEAQTRYRLVAGAAALSLVELHPETGRTHQLRVQLASRGWPIWGDRKYGSAHEFMGIALHARELRFAHPTRSETITLTAPLPRAWRANFPREWFQGVP